MRFVVHDRDTKFPTSSDVVFASEGIEAMLTPYRAPNANAYAQRWVRSVREECLDHLLIMNERYLDHVLREYGQYYNRARPHQGIVQQIPELPTRTRASPAKGYPGRPPPRRRSRCSLRTRRAWDGFFAHYSLSGRTIGPSGLLTH